MVRNYKRERGSRDYRNYTDNQLLDAVEAVKKGMTLRKAEEKYKVKRETIRKTVNNLKKGVDVIKKPVGGQTALNADEEAAICQHVVSLATWGFPITTMELRLIVMSYIKRLGRTVRAFSDGCTPGEDWALAFMKRHKNKLSVRDASNINVNRAQVSPEDINLYFDNLEQGVSVIPPSNIINYDETNLSDDPGRKKCIAKRGQKYFNRVMSSTKSSTSIMFACTATGDFLAPFVVYKAENIYDLWVIGGPPGTRYGCSKSGWFDTLSFEEWFFSIVLPFVRKNKNGEKFLVIGDNLSSHFSQKVLEACRDNDIEFRCLPPNSTHLCQPLDVALYGPLKRNWRQVLVEFKSQNVGKNVTVAKSDFPRLLSNLMERMKPTMVESAINGFKKTGIHPLDRDQVLNMLPQLVENDPDTNLISESFLEYLRDIRYPKQTEKRRVKKKKINVDPGKSVGVEDLLQVATVEAGRSTSSTKKAEKKKATGKKKDDKVVKPKKKRSEDTDSEDVDTPDDMYQESDEENLEDFLKNVIDEGKEEDMEQDEIRKPKFGSWVLVKFSTKKTCKHFVGQITSVAEDTDGDGGDFTVKFLRKCGNFFQWPEQQDVSAVDEQDIVVVLPEPLPGRRGQVIFKMKFDGYNVQ